MPLSPSSPSGSRSHCSPAPTARTGRSMRSASRPPPSPASRCPPGGARRAEREAARERRLAAAEERTRIARDLHDSAAHAINVILVQAGAARLLQPRDPKAVQEALTTIEDVARETIGEIDRLVGALREDGG